MGPRASVDVWQDTDISYPQRDSTVAYSLYCLRYQGFTDCYQYGEIQNKTCSIWDIITVTGFQWRLVLSSDRFVGPTIDGRVTFYKQLAAGGRVCEVL